MCFGTVNGEAMSCVEKTVAQGLLSCAHSLGTTGAARVQGSLPFMLDCGRSSFMRGYVVCVVGRSGNPSPEAQDRSAQRRSGTSAWQGECKHHWKGPTTWNPYAVRKPEPGFCGIPRLQSLHLGPAVGEEWMNIGCCFLFLQHPNKFASLTLL